MFHCVNCETCPRSVLKSVVSMAKSRFWLTYTTLSQIQGAGRCVATSLLGQQKPVAPRACAKKKEKKNWQWKFRKLVNCQAVFCPTHPWNILLQKSDFWTQVCDQCAHARVPTCEFALSKSDKLLLRLRWDPPISWTALGVSLLLGLTWCSSFVFCQNDVVHLELGPLGLAF